MANPEQLILKNYYREVSNHINGISGNVPAHRKASKHPYSFSAFDFGQQLAIWDYIWKNTSDFWIKVHAIFFLERHMKNNEALKQMWPVIVNWQDNVDDWGLCDALAKIYTRVLIVLPDVVYQTLKNWNKDKNLWKRRQSVVSLLYFSRVKKTYPSFDKIAGLISPLLKDREYYVEKGVGWALRELNSVYPKDAKSFLNTHIRSVSSIAFTIAIEKMGVIDKNKLKALRKA